MGRFSVCPASSKHLQILHFSSRMPFPSFFKNGIRDEKCRICKCLEEAGQTENLYEDHFAPYPAGCPRFAQMSTLQRKEIVDLARICIFCLDFKYVHRVGVQHPNCPAFKGPVFYSCQNQSCKLHYLVCDEHEDDNKEKLERTSRLWSNRGKVFSHVVSVICSSPSISLSSTLTSASVPQPTVFNSVINGTLKVASDKLKSLAKGVPVDDLPSGDPLFMFSFIPGKTRPLNVFWDQGCSHLLMRSDVPELQLPAVKTRKGPLMMNELKTVGWGTEAEVSVEDREMLGLEQITDTTWEKTFPLLDHSLLVLSSFSLLSSSCSSHTR